MRLNQCIALLSASILTACVAEPPRGGDEVVITIIGTNDVHGQFSPAHGRGGLTTISGYLEALRQAHPSDEVLLIDAGDMWQGTLESNLNEGALIVETYNAMGYAAAAIGNHEFDFGPIGYKAIPIDDNDDARGALKARARDARFPLLSANLIDESTGRVVDWQNVVPSTMIMKSGINIGVIGVMTEYALASTIATNTPGLSVAPLATSIEGEAKRLRSAGADIVIVTAHAGGRCHDFSNPADISACEMDSEIMRVAEALPTGLVDHIIAGHVHEGIAHIINGTSITSSYAHTYAFSRVDFVFERSTERLISRTVHPPQVACPYRIVPGGDCAWAFADDGSTVVAKYEGRPISPDPLVVEIAKRASLLAKARKEQALGSNLEMPFTLKGNPESALGNLFTDALLSSLDADIAIHNVSGGIRATLPAGELRYGDIYEVFPFDNRAVILEISGLDLRRIIAAQAKKLRRRAGFSGMRVHVDCADNVLNVKMLRDDGKVIRDKDRLRVVANDFLALGGDDIFTPALPADGFAIDNSLPLTRDILVAWLEARESLHPEDFLTGAQPKWRVDGEIPETCVLH